MSASNLDPAPRAGALWGAAWAAIPEAVARRLRDGGAALEVGCGRGLACLALAEAFPAARIVGHDVDPAAIAQAAALAAGTGLASRLELAVADSTRLPRAAFDLVVVRDILTRPSDPRRLLNAIRNTLCPDGSCLVIETATHASPGAAPTLRELARGAGFSRFRAHVREGRLQIAELGR